MNNSYDPLLGQAEVADLSRRLGILEVLFLGRKYSAPHPSLLVSLYWDACRGFGLDETTARHWERQIFCLDARTLLVMARSVRDPTPWHPLLVIVDKFIEGGFDLEACRQHLLGSAQDLLNLQGFRKINPRWVAGNPLRIKTALAAISRRGGLHGKRESK